MLNPRNLNNGYYVETGWATNSEIELPNSKSLWTIEGNNKLDPNNSVRMLWKKNKGIIFEKKISIDKQYLFTIDQIILRKKTLFFLVCHFF